MPTCFVIQPFAEPYLSRYNDIFDPAIREAGLEPDRVDKDPAVGIIIDEIERKIHDADIILAEISKDNPNVWYELGYALASDKNVVMVCCEEERTGNFPLDIRHRRIVSYSSASKSHYEKLKAGVVETLKALMAKERRVQRVAESPLVETEGLPPEALTMLAIIASIGLYSGGWVGIWTVGQDMEKYGFTDMATYYAIKTLTRRKLVISDHRMVDERDEEPREVLSLTPEGEAWALQNWDKFNFRKTRKKRADPDPEPPPLDDEVPF